MDIKTVSERNSYSAAALGYNGKILTVDLTNSTYSVAEPHEHYWRTFGGGGLLAADKLPYLRDSDVVDIDI